MWTGIPNINIIPPTEIPDRMQPNKHPIVVKGITMYNINGIIKQIIENFITGIMTLNKNIRTSKFINRLSKYK